jgi:DNA invertase Pin-like site-specific DNA recombinase
VRFIAVNQGVDTDQNNPIARLTLNLLSAFADFERSLISERTRSGLARARAVGRVGGKPRAAFDEHQAAVMLGNGMSMAQVGKLLGCNAATISRRKIKPLVLSPVQADVASALQNLGCQRSQALELMADIDPTLDFDSALRLALAGRVAA